MRILRLPRPAGAVPLAPVYGAVTLIAGVGAAVAVSLPDGFLPVFCPFHAVSGFPCPTCGSTRALASLIQGRIGSALCFNPLVSLAALFLVIAGTISAIRWTARVDALRCDASPGEEVVVRIAAAAALAANWIYLLIKE